MATQDELRRHCIQELGMSEKRMENEEIPQGVLLICRRPLTAAEEAHALTLKSTLDGNHEGNLRTN